MYTLPEIEKKGILIFYCIRPVLLLLQNQTKLWGAGTNRREEEEGKSCEWRIWCKCCAHMYVKWKNDTC
jgi:hypothetical protein